MRWRYKALGISVMANLVAAASVPFFGYFIAWLLIPGVYPAFWLCNSLDPGCKSWPDDVVWMAGWFLNVMIAWLIIWCVGSIRLKRRA